MVRTSFSPARFSPLPLRERKGPIAQRWEGEGAAPSMGAIAPSPSHASRGPLPLPHGERGFASSQGVSPRQPLERRVGGELILGAGLAALQLDGAGGEAARTDDELPGEADQVHGGEFRAGAL